MNSTIHSFKRFDLKKYSTFFTLMCLETDEIRSALANIRIATEDYYINIDTFSVSLVYHYDYTTLSDTFEFFDLMPGSLKHPEYIISKDFLQITSCKLPKNDFNFKAIHFYRTPKEHAALALLHENKHCIMIEHELGKKNKPKPIAKIMRYTIS